MLSDWSVQRRKRVALVAGLLVIVLGLLWTAQGALFPYIFALVVAYLVLPAVNRLDAVLGRLLRNQRLARPIAILAVYLLVGGLIVLFFRLVWPIAGRQFRTLWVNRELIAALIQSRISEGLGWYQVNVPADIQTYLEQSLRQATDALSRSIQTGLLRTVGVVRSTVSFAVGMFIVPFWLFYILNDEFTVTRGVLSLIPTRFRADVRAWCASLIAS